MANGELVILSGSAHPELADNIAGELGVEVVDADIGHFPDGESHVHIQGAVRERDVFVVQPTGPSPERGPNDNVMELVLILDALRRASVRRANVVAPYFAYARQDRKDQSRVPISGSIVAQTIVNAGADRMMSVDLHAHQAQGWVNVPWDHLYARDSIAAVLDEDYEEPVIVAPDPGAINLASGMAHQLDTKYGLFDKTRITPSVTKLGEYVGTSVVGRTAVLLDDIVSTAGTMDKAAIRLMDMGAEQVVGAGSHGVLSPGAAERVQRGTMQELVITDTLAQPTDLPRKIREVSVAPMLAEAIRKTHEGESVSSLFVR